MRLIIHNLFPQSIQSEYIPPSALPFCLTVPLILFPYKQNQVPSLPKKRKPSSSDAIVSANPLQSKVHKHYSNYCCSHLLLD